MQLSNLAVTANPSHHIAYLPISLFLSANKKADYLSATSLNYKIDKNMAEQEVIKHTKKVYKIWNSKEHTFWHKAKEFVLEIAIIVFAVSLSIWFHNQSEHAKQQGEVKEFLLGLKEDLTGDIREMTADKESYDIQRIIFNYISNLKIKENPNQDTLHKYLRWIFNTTELNPNDGRLEGFKSSGKIGTIENKVLQNDIMDLYQEDIASLLLSTRLYISNKRKLFDFVLKNQKRITDSTTNIITLLKADEVINLSSSLSDTYEVIDRYNTCIMQMRKIIAEIDKQYGNEH